MVSAEVVTLLEIMGFVRDRDSLVDAWTLREGALTFRAQAVWARDGIQLNASMHTARVMYSSEGLLSDSVQSMTLSPAGYLGPAPTEDDIRDRMDELREQAGIQDPRITEMFRAIAADDREGVAAVLTHTPSHVSRRHGSLRESVLHRAVSAPVADLLVACGAHLDARDRFGRTPLHAASTRSIAQVLLGHGADPNTQDNSGHSPLHDASTPEVVAALLDGGANLSLQDSKGLTPLHRFVMDDKREAAAVVLVKGGNPDALTRSGATALHFVRSVGVLNLLVDFGVDIRAVDCQRRTPLFFQSNLAIAEAMVHLGLDVTAMDQEGGTALHHARSAGVADLLLHRGLALEARDTSGRTPLHSAVFSKASSVARHLVQKGANVQARTAAGETPLHFAGALTDARILLEHGAEVDAIDSQGRSPLHYARSPRLVKLLLEHGADVSLRDQQGHLPSDQQHSIQVGKLLAKSMRAQARQLGE